MNNITEVKKKIGDAEVLWQSDSKEGENNGDDWRKDAEDCPKAAPSRVSAARYTLH